MSFELLSVKSSSRFPISPWLCLKRRPNIFYCLVQVPVCLQAHHAQITFFVDYPGCHGRQRHYDPVINVRPAGAAAFFLQYADNACGKFADNYCFSQRIFTLEQFFVHLGPYYADSLGPSNNLLPYRECPSEISMQANQSNSLSSQRPAFASFGPYTAS